MQYRKKPIKVEAWQIGSDEPKPDWAMPERYPCAYEGCWLVHEVKGHGVHHVHWYQPEEFEELYEVVK